MFGWFISYKHYTLESCYNAFQYSKMLHKYLQEIKAEYQSDAGSAKDTPYLALTGELYGVFCG